MCPIAKYYLNCLLLWPEFWSQYLGIYNFRRILLSSENCNGSFRLFGCSVVFFNFYERNFAVLSCTQLSILLSGHQIIQQSWFCLEFSSNFERITWWRQCGSNLNPFSILWIRNSRVDRKKINLFLLLKG